MSLLKKKTKLCCIWISSTFESIWQKIINCLHFLLTHTYCFNWYLIGTVVSKNKSCAQKVSHLIIKNLNHMYIKNKIIMCLSDANQPKASLKLKTYRKSGIQIANWNVKLDIMLRQVNESQNLRQPIENTHNGFQLLARIKLTGFIIL